MTFVKHLVLLLSFACSPLCYSAACPTSSSTATEGNGNCTVTGSASTILINFNSGFDSSTAVSAIDGNNGSTIGAQRKLSFIKAAEIITEALKSTVTIEVDASFSNLECNVNEAVLGSAGATNNIAYGVDFDGLAASTYYPVGLANAISGSDLDPSGSDIVATFSRDLGDADCLPSSGWYYGFGTLDDSTQKTGFTSVLLHEITHGLGFASLVNSLNGAKPSNIDDVFSNHLFDKSTGLNFNDDEETNQNRENASVSVNGLLWSGINTNAQATGKLINGFDDINGNGIFESGDKIQMYAPDSLESGSSVSHFNTDASPNELMEPSYTQTLYELGLAIYLLQDLGWSIVTEQQAIGQQVSIDGVTLGDNDTIALDLTNKQIDVPGNSDDFQYNLEYQGGDVTQLLTPNDTGVSIALPASGAFAGTYTLTILNTQTDEEITLTITRPLRLNFSTLSLLNGDINQTLKIEGGTVGSRYTVTQTPDNILVLNHQDNLTAPNDADNFNATTSLITSNTVDNIIDVVIGVSFIDSNDEEVFSTLLIHPSQNHTVTVYDNEQSPLENVNANITSTNDLLTFNLELNYITNEEGQFNFPLPIYENEEDFELSLQVSDFIESLFDFTSSTQQHDFTLEPMALPITLSGNISAPTGIDFSASPPSVQLQFLNSQAIALSIEVISSSLARFSQEVDLAQVSLENLTIEQDQSQSTIIDVSSTIQSQSFEVQLEALDTSNEEDRSGEENTNIESTGIGGGGSFHYLWLLVFVSMLSPLRTLRTIKIGDLK